MWYELLSINTINPVNEPTLIGFGSDDRSVKTMWQMPIFFASASKETGRIPEEKESCPLLIHGSIDQRFFRTKRCFISRHPFLFTNKIACFYSFWLRLRSSRPNRWKAIVYSLRENGAVWGMNPKPFHVTVWFRDDAEPVLLTCKTCPFIMPKLPFYRVILALWQRERSQHDVRGAGVAIKIYYCPPQFGLRASLFRPDYSPQRFFLVLGRRIIVSRQ